MFALVGVVSLGADRPTQNFKTWGALAEKLFHTSLIAKPDSAAQQELVNILKTMPPDVQNKWAELLKARMVAGVSFPCPQCTSPAHLALALATSISVQCAACGADLEVAEDLLRNSFLDLIRTEQASGMRQGVACASHMDKIFGLLCRAAETITVVDRYGVSDAYRLFLQGSNRSGLQRFISLAARHNVAELRIVASSGMQLNRVTLTPVDVESHLRALLATTARGAMGITLDVVKKGPAMTHMHDRRLGFSWGTGGEVSWTLGRGLGQFNGNRARADCTMARQADSSTSAVVTAIAADIEHTARL
jgi:hypothetical protein